MLLVTPVYPVTSEGADESWAHSRALTVLSSVPSSTDDRDPDDDETGGDKKPPLPTTSRRRNASQKSLKATQSSEPIATQTRRARGGPRGGGRCYWTP